MSSAFLIKPRISIFLFLFFSSVYLLSFLLFYLMHMPLLLHFVISLFLLFHFVYVVRRYVLCRHPMSVTRLWCDDNNEWKIQCHDQHVRAATLFQSVIISRFLIFLAFRVPGRFLPVPVSLALDSDQAKNIRSLRQHLQTSKL